MASLSDPPGRVGEYLDQDGGMLFIGPEAERRFGHRHFMGLTAVFTAPPQFTVLQGRHEIGRTDPSLLTERIDGPRRLLLAGRSWQVTYIDLRRKRCFVEPADGGGKAKWSGAGFGSAGSYELTRAERQVLLGEDLPVNLTQRASHVLRQAREAHLERVHPTGTVIIRDWADEVVDLGRPPYECHTRRDAQRRRGTGPGSQRPLGPATGRCRSEGMEGRDEGGR